MSDVKWIKIATDIFNNNKIKMIEAMPDGDALIVIWFKILMLAGDTNDSGLIYVANNIPYDDISLSTIFNKPISLIQLALNTFEHFGMIEIVDDFIHISNWEKYQNVDGMEKLREQNRLRVAKHREKKKIECNVTSNVTSNANVTHCNAIEEELDKDIDIDKEKDIKEKEIPKGISKKKAFSNNNIENFENMLNCENKEDSIIYINNNFVLVDAIKDWLEYKQGKGKQHLVYQEIGMRKFLSSIVEKDKTYGTRGVVRAINESISQGWQGIVWDKAEIPKAEMSYEEKKEQEEEQFLNKFGLTKEKFI